MRVLITGGAGFIGSNAVAHFCNAGHEVLVIDNLSRPSSLLNIRDLRLAHKFIFVEADLSISASYESAFRDFRPEVVLHLAGQVAVTTSVSDPELDFHSNALATFVLLEQARKLKSSPFVIFASTNKVYGELAEIAVVERTTRYEYEVAGMSISEEMSLNFHSPYGCSKGTADQYVLEYARTFDVPGVVFRQSCIYGPGQYGIEDQGWVAWFIAATMLGKPLTVFGDGKQVRDVLHVADLLTAFDAAIATKGSCTGQAFNIGGGNKNTLSILELISSVEDLTGGEISWSHGPWRPSDQKVFISDISKAQRLLGWKPEINPNLGLKTLETWVRGNLSGIESVLQ
jgi:CDP-paratose 2-epimerase